MDGSRIDFVCNICGCHNNVTRDRIGREVQGCDYCGSTGRHRAVVHMLGVELYGRPTPLASFPKSDSIAGIGLSDVDVYAIPLAEKLNYENTYFHTQPFMDITSPGKSRLGTLDFIIASDVYEHIPPPIGPAFAGAYALLKPGGFMIWTAPLHAKMAMDDEFYPRLKDFTSASIGDRHFIVVMNEDGNLTLDPNPVFHGGPGRTLAFRIFGGENIKHHFSQAGFSDIEILAEPIVPFGIDFNGPDDLPILARKPR